MAKWVWFPPTIEYAKLIQQVANWSQVSCREGCWRWKASLGR